MSAFTSERETGCASAMVMSFICVAMSNKQSQLPVVFEFQREWAFAFGAFLHG